MENYIGEICPFCKNEITQQDAVRVCPDCGTAHHERCWNENHGCTTFGCSQQYYGGQPADTAAPAAPVAAPVAPAAPAAAPAAPAAAPQLNLCVKCGNVLPVGQTFCPKCGNNNVAANNPASAPANPYVPGGAPSYGANPNAYTPAGANPNAYTPAGANPNAYTPAGANPNAYTPAGANPNAYTPAGVNPNAYTPAGANPNAYTPAGTNPNAYTPAGANTPYTPAGAPGYGANPAINQYNNQQQKKKKSPVIAIIAVILAAVIGLGVLIGSIASAANAKEEYLANAEEFLSLSITAGANLEEIADTIQEYWYDNIWHDKWGNDINDAIAYALRAKSSEISQAKQYDARMKSLYSKLKNVPDSVTGSDREELQDICDAVRALYNVYTDYYTLAVDPSGSYNSYSASNKSLTDSFLSKYRALKNILE